MNAISHRRRPPLWRGEAMQARAGAVVRRALPVVVLMATIGALVLAVDPRSFARAMSRLNLLVLPVLIGLGLVFYLLQGLRWHQLLREVGVRLRATDSVLLNMAGQAITAILPLGDLTRAVFASEAASADFGQVAATVTVQELAYTLILVLSAAPMMLDLRHGVAVVVIIVLGIAAVVVILTVQPVFCLVHRLVAHTPGLRRLLSQIDELHGEVVLLLRRPDTLGWTFLDVGRAAVAVTTLWIVVWGLHPGVLGWWGAAFVLALSYVGGAISLIPGGAGANEASMVGLMVLVGVDAGTATAATLLQRVFTTGLASALGWGAYAVARRRFNLSSMMLLRHPADEPVAAVRQDAA